MFKEFDDMKKCLLFFLFFLIVAISSCVNWRECTEETLSSSTSPNGIYVADHFVRNCGATTPFVYHINLRKSTNKFPINLSGTITEGTVITIASQKLVMEWKDDNMLSVKCMNCKPGVKYKMEKTWQNVNIAFDLGENAK